MRWRLKALAQQVFSLLPGGAALDTMAQTHLTRGFQVDDDLVAPMVGLSGETMDGSDADRALVGSGRLHASYRGRDPEDLTIREAHIVARKPGAS